MASNKEIITYLTKTYPHSTALIQVFVPLVQAQEKFLQKTPPIDLPVFDPCAFTAGKPWIPSNKLPYTDAFFKKAITHVSNSIIKELPEQKNFFMPLKEFLKKDINAAKELLHLRLENKTNQITKWAKKHKQHADATAFLAMLLSSTMAKAIRANTTTQSLPNWNKGYCPICGSLPHGSLLKETEGKRYLNCSLCAHEWAFSRTTCPICEQNDVKKFSLFFFEDRPSERAEGCDNCKQYLLSIDTRKSSNTSYPLELYFLCLGPLDVLMQEKGYSPASTTNAV